jgi:hypothetical protein
LAQVDEVLATVIGIVVGGANAGRAGGENRVRVSEKERACRAVHWTDDANQDLIEIGSEIPETGQIQRSAL